MIPIQVAKTMPLGTRIRISSTSEAFTLYGSDAGEIVEVVGREYSKHVLYLLTTRGGNVRLPVLPRLASIH